jgi:hypothetical protein
MSVLRSERPPQKISDVGGNGNKWIMFNLRGQSPKARPSLFRELSIPPESRDLPIFPLRQLAASFKFVVDATS